MKNLIAEFRTQPGINRDRTIHDSESFSDGQWVRSVNGRPRKIGGYKLLSVGTDQITRKMFISPLGNKSRVFMFRDNGIFQMDINKDGSITAEIDRTPVGFVAATTTPYIWSVDRLPITDGVNSVAYIFAVAMKNAEDPAQSEEAQIYYGQVILENKFVTVNGQSTSGGLIVSFPYLMKYGNNGIINWSSDSNPTLWPVANFLPVSTTKIVGGARYKGAALLWSLNELIRLVYNSNLGTYTSSTTTCSILSAQTIVEANNDFFWIGDNKFYRYNGLVQKIPNEYNQLFFFDNLNRDYVGKVWGMYIGLFDEIWWFWPDKDHTECNRVLIFNLNDGSWSDSIISRSTGISSPVTGDIYMASSDGNDLIVPNRYGIWQHEVEYDRNEFGSITPIVSYFKTQMFSIFKASAENNVQFRTRRIERDINQTGDMFLEVYNYAFPQSDPQISDPIHFTDIQNAIDVKQMGRFVSYKFTSNTLGGFYQVGANLIDYEPGTVRPSQGSFN